MSIIIGALTIATAVYLRIKFGKVARRTTLWFGFSIFAGLVSTLTVMGTSFWRELGFSLLALAVCGFVLTVYKHQINRAYASRRAVIRSIAKGTYVHSQAAKRAKAPASPTFYGDRDFASRAA